MFLHCKWQGRVGQITISKAETQKNQSNFCPKVAPAIRNLQVAGEGRLGQDLETPKANFQSYQTKMFLKIQPLLQEIDCSSVVKQRKTDAGFCCSGL